MAVRTSMAEHILSLRRMTDASAAEVTVNGVQYWTDQQLQDILDTYRTDVLDLAMIPAVQKSAGSDVYFRYYFPDSVGSQIEYDPTLFSIVDEDGNPAPTYSYNPGDRYILFSANTNGVTYLFRGRFFNLRTSAARVWFDKAGLRTQLIDWKAGGQNLNEDQEYQHCMQMFELYSGTDGVDAILPGSGTRGSRRLRKVGYNGQDDSTVQYYPTGTATGINGPVA